MEGDQSVEAAATRSRLVRHFRCVAFAALGEGVPEAELQAALQVAVAAEARRKDAEILTPRPRLYLVP